MHQLWLMYPRTYDKAIDITNNTIVIGIRDHSLSSFATGMFLGLSCLTIFVSLAMMCMAMAAVRRSLGRKKLSGHFKASRRRLQVQNANIRAHVDDHDNQHVVHVQLHDAFQKIILLFVGQHIQCERVLGALTVFNQHMIINMLVMFNYSLSCAQFQRLILLRTLVPLLTYSLPMTLSVAIVHFNALQWAGWIQWLLLAAILSPFVSASVTIYTIKSFREQARDLFSCRFGRLLKTRESSGELGSLLRKNVG